MKKIRFLLLFALVLSPIFSLQVEAQDDVIEIEYWQYFFEARVTAMDMLIEQFEAENPDVHVIHNSDIAYDNFRTEMATAAAARCRPRCRDPLLWMDSRVCRCGLSGSAA